MAAVARLHQRRSERTPAKIPVVLLVESEGGKFEWSASTADLSDHGLKIKSNIPLTRGESLEVVFGGASEGARHCRVVWVGGAGFAQAGELGLEFLN